MTARILSTRSGSTPRGCADRRVTARHIGVPRSVVAPRVSPRLGKLATTFAERAANARAVAEANGRHVGRPVAHPPEKIEYARLLKAQGHSLGAITSKTGIPKTSLHRYLADLEVGAQT